MHRYANEYFDHKFTEIECLHRISLFGILMKIIKSSQKNIVKCKMASSRRFNFTYSVGELSTGCDYKETKI